MMPPSTTSVRLSTSLLAWTIVILMLSTGHAQSEPLWPKGAPASLGDKPTDVPKLTLYPAAEPRNKVTLLILPGGGYGSLSRAEGEGFGRWFASQGITSYVLSYRLGSSGYRHPVMLQDAAHALRTVRAAARRDGLDTDKIVIVGSSAGGHLASTLLTHFDAGDPNSTDPVERESSRPDAGVLCYPVITLEGPFAHGGSRNNLLGPTPTPDLLKSLSNDQQVTPQTPPCFIWHCGPDRNVPIEHSLLFASALRKAGVPFELHIYEDGDHGIGMPATNAKSPPWDQACLRWLHGLGFLAPSPVK